MTAKNILIVDDDAGQRRLMQFWLEEEGYRTLTADNGKAGFELYEEKSPQLVIADIRMPGMSGLQLLGRIKGTNPDASVILVTAFGTVETAVEAMKLGAMDYILKPLNADELKMVVRRAFERQQLLDENRYLRDLAGSALRFESLVGRSRKMEEVFDLALQVARSDSTVLLIGESGTGKELLAKAIHQNSLRAGKPFVTINCGAIPENLIESELFGHRKGSFTGALADRTGKFEAASEGTVFLDEVSELAPQVQVRLLRVLQEREIDKIGYPRPIKVNVRVLAATNRNLKNLVEDGQFREDVYYRLSVITIPLPPLRERKEDIPLLIDHFIAKHSERQHLAAISLEDETLEALKRYNWPGNVRELENVIERSVVLGKGKPIVVEQLPTEMRLKQTAISNLRLALPDEGISLEEIEREILLQALEKHNWNQTRAAKYLDISRKTLIYRMEKFGLETPAEAVPPEENSHSSAGESGRSSPPDTARR